MVTVLLLWPVFAHAVNVWSSQEELTFGFLLPPVVVAIIWWRRQEFRRRDSNGAPAGFWVVLVALIALVVFERLAARSPAAVAAGLLLWGIAVYLWGWPAARVLAFPVALLTIGLTLQQTLLSSLSFPLQEITAAQAADLSRILGLPIVKEGLVLRTDAFAFEIAEACSGMNSLLALLTLAVLWIYVGSSSPAARVAVLVSVLPVVVIVTAYNQYAVEAFEAGAVDYLLKPIQQSRLEKAVARARALQGRGRERAENAAKLTEVLVPGNVPRVRKIVGRSGEEYFLLDLNEVLAFQAEGEVVWIVTSKTRYMATQPLRAIESRLKNLPFQRVHRNAIVNVNHVRKLSSMSSQRWLLTLSNSQELIVSKRQAHSVRNMLKW